MPLGPDDRRRVTEARVARLATTRPDGRPHVVPITFALGGERIVTAIDQKPKTTARLQRLENIAFLPAASVIVDHYDDDWSRLWWVRADGTAHVVTGGREWQEGVEQLTQKYHQYREETPRGPLIVISVDRWTSWAGAPERA